MKLSFDYDRHYFPAFPVLEIRITGTYPNSGRAVICLIDSGSDATQIPLSILRAIGAREVDRRWVQDLGGIRYNVGVFGVQILIGDIVMPSIEVVGRAGIDEAIIGRDVLNQLIVTMNGLAYVTEISDRTLPECLVKSLSYQEFSVYRTKTCSLKNSP